MTFKEAWENAAEGQWIEENEHGVEFQKFEKEINMQQDLEISLKELFSNNWEIRNENSGN